MVFLRVNAVKRIRVQERGQALLLGVVALVVLSIGMYTTYNISRSVYEKIKLQNAADAAAYSLANLEARTFNFIAFTNRAQVANYVQMLEAQSLLSSATFVEGYVGWGGEMAHAMGASLKLLYRVLCVATLGTGCGPLQWIDAMGDTLKQVGQTLRQTYETSLRPTVDTMDEFVPRYIKLMTSKNQALFGVSFMMALATGTQLAAGMQDIALSNDPGANTDSLVTEALAAYNAALYAGAFDFSSLRPNHSSSSSRQANRLMTELVNASRYGGATPDFVVSREPFEWLGEVTQSMSGGGGRGSAKVDNIIGDVLGDLGAPDFVGTSKLIDERDGGPAQVDDTASHGFGQSDLSVGAALVAKDQARAFNWEPFASVVSGRAHGEHCRYVPPTQGWGGVQRLPSILRGDDFQCDAAHGDEHRWNDLLGISGGGIQPYLKFSPEPSLLASSSGFNQPDVWIWLNKKPEAMALVGAVPDLKIEADSSARFDAAVGNEPLVLPAGMNALARAQVYYHRPGAWQEMPNFFNPYWGARLAPKGEAIDRLLSGLPLPDFINQLVADNIWMH